MTSTIHAVYPDGSGVREASLKLQALRAQLVEDGSDGSSLTATIGDEFVDLALHVIKETGGITAS
ncbi:hypothetical protein Back11_26580 [Paenibacillus baekrokdamisoli]|uniref:Uncharacterized protein n=1 Tax=Paenibacillus baekrokdamisoli TaxID=1712516 RepID=A0A3G9J8X5_9BACL|nr:hypothetical protein [Paenibacillus baekrokdamisoli]MBB3070308.1 hypothetical protein [Paenibacillus baekrokdamisoli]BBH21313.1 hypothetical protein Back11_26580 [Paenibacillus baekrokdamisoli]